MTALLSAEQVTKRFRRPMKPPVTALEDVTFRLFPGEALGVVGESGSGKSTLALAVTRLISLTAGTVQIDGQDISRAGGRELRRAWRKVQLVFQSPAASFDPRRTLGESIGESLRNRGLSRREAAEGAEALLLRCGLPGELRDRYPHEVSGGQCQRAAIARALGAEPRALLCDEATSALDVSAQRQIMALLQSLRETEGLSVLFISHDLALAQSFCSRLLVMEGGRIVEEGATEEVILRPRTDYTRRLIEAAL